MLKTNNPNISIITNFGCQTNCWYCIWKNHPLKNIQSEIDWEKLERFLLKYKDKGKVSVSGGGDCLYNYTLYKESFWNKFISLCNKNNIKIDIHSRQVFYNDQFCT